MVNNDNDSLDHFISGSPIGQNIIVDINPHLSYPSQALGEPATRPESSILSRPPQLCKDRIYVGNLHTSVDEWVYSLLIYVFATPKRSRLDIH